LKAVIHRHKFSRGVFADVIAFNLARPYKHDNYHRAHRHKNKIDATGEVAHQKTGHKRAHTCPQAIYDIAYCAKAHTPLGLDIIVGKGRG